MDPLTHPERLAWLALLPVLYWLSRPVRPRREVATAHLTQWLRARARLRRKRVRFEWLRFLLLALAFVAGVLAFAGPRIGGQEGPSELAVVLDTSASMGARRGSEPSAWEAARARAEERLRSLPGPVDVRVALCGEGVHLLTGPVDEIVAALPAEPSGAGSVRLDQIVERAGAAAGGRVAVWCITDGLGPTALPRTGALTVVGRPAPNFAITELEVEDPWPLPDVVLRVRVQGFATSARRLRVAAEGGGVEPSAPIDLELAAGGDRRVELALRRAQGGAVRVALLDTGDALSADDVVEVELPAPAAPDIAVLADSESDGSIEVAAKFLAGVVGGRVLPRDAAERAGFLLVEGGVLPRQPGSMRFVTFGTRPGGRALTADDVVLAPQIVDWDRDDGITRGLDLSELRVRSCLRRDFLGAGKVLIRAAHGPVATVDTGAEREVTSVHFAFRLSDSNLPLLAAFPQLLTRCMARSYGDAARPAIRPGALLSAAESALTTAASDRRDRPLPAFREPPTELVLPLLLLALGLLVARIYV